MDDPLTGTSDPQPVDALPDGRCRHANAIPGDHAVTAGVGLVAITSTLFESISIEAIQIGLRALDADALVQQHCPTPPPR